MISPKLKFNLQTRTKKEVLAAIQAESSNDFRRLIQCNVQNLDIKSERGNEIVVKPEETIEMIRNKDFMDTVRKLVHSLFCICRDTADKPGEVLIATILDENTGNIIAFMDGIIQGEEMDMIDCAARQDKELQRVDETIHGEVVRELVGRGTKKLTTSTGSETEVAFLRSMGYQPVNEDEDNDDFYLNI